MALTATLVGLAARDAGRVSALAWRSDQHPLYAVIHESGNDEMQGQTLETLIQSLERSFQLLDESVTWPRTFDESLSLAQNVLRLSLIRANRAAWSASSGGRFASATVAHWSPAWGLAFAHVGLTRVYRLRAGVVERLTRDHSVAEDHLRVVPQPTREAASVYARTITRAVGAAPDLEVDVTVVMPEANDVYVLCTSQLNVDVEARALELLANSDTIAVAAPALVEGLPHDRAGAVLLLRIDAQPERAAIDAGGVGTPAESARAPIQPLKACLVVTYANDRAFFGRRFDLDADESRIGRAADANVHLDSHSMSRLHASIRRHAETWWIRDEGSTNGSYVNDEWLTGERQLADGDRLRLGTFVLGFLSGSDLDERFHTTLSELAELDGLTRAYTSRHLMQYLQTQFIPSSRRGALLLIEIDRFRELNDAYGEAAANQLLVELARAARDAGGLSGILARWSGDRLALLLPDVGPLGAANQAEALRAAIERRRFAWLEERIVVTGSIAWDAVQGAQGLSTPTTAGDRVSQLAALLDHGLHLARRDGGNRVVSMYRSDVEDAASTTRRCLDGPLLVQRVLACAPRPAIISFEIDDEPTVLQRLGTAGYDAWFHELVRDAEGATDANDLLGSWRDRYVLLGVSGRDAAGLAELVARIQQTWASRPIAAEHQAAVARSLRAATLMPDEVGTHGERALGVLVSRLLEPAEPLAPLDDLDWALPFPVAVARGYVSARRTPFSQTKALLDAIELSLRFLVGIELAILRDGEDEHGRDELVRLLRQHAPPGRPLSMGTWEHLAWQLASLLPEHDAAPVSAAARQLLGRRNSRSTLAEKLHAAVGVRNAFAHGKTLAEDSYAAQAKSLGETLDLLVNALRPLRDLRLTSVADIEHLDDDDAIGYAMRLHTGPAEHFPIVRETIKSKLHKGWCYLLAGRDQTPLCLAPVVASCACETCGRDEVYLAETLTFGPKGSKVRIRGVTSSHTAEVEIPSHRGLAVLDQRIRAERL
jgi:diguanylate cyclase (GGDEF)-like protein